MKIKIGKYPKKSDKNRKVKIRIDPQDTWALNETLAIIIVPLLKQLRESKHGAPLVDDCDVPEHLRSTACGPKEHEWDIDANHFARWEWVMDEMIWAFEQHTIEWDQQYFHGNFDFEVKDGTLLVGSNNTSTIDHDGIKAHSERMKNGRILFAKYYDSLWD